MTLKEKLEILRGEPIKVFEGDPKDIPCIETSDAERLCKHPVVSVHMITYNHEPYIRQAIEGVMLQKTDFEFELVIGEDCSQDKTREICFEYQKKYPDKIRVLWWHENVSTFGGNSRRVTVHCRGEFIAFCEGDDYWIDSFKLQKQVDVMRKNPNVGLCFCGAQRYKQATRQFETWPVDFPSGVVPNMQFFSMMVDCDWWPRRTIATASVMFRQKYLNRIRELYDILRWRLCLGDFTLWTALGMVTDVYFLPDVVSVYRMQSNGACGRGVNLVNRDALIVKEYYIFKRYGVNFRRIPRSFLSSQLQSLIYAYREEDFSKRISYVKKILFLGAKAGVPLCFPIFSIAFMHFIGIDSSLLKRVVYGFVRIVLHFNRVHFTP